MELALRLTELGLSEKEAKTYLAALELGPSSMLEISRKSGVNRGTTYNIISGLIEKGIIIKTIEKGKTTYLANDPSFLMNLVKQKEELLKTAMPELAALNNISKRKPKITFFEGRQGFVKGISDYLTAEKEVMMFSSPLTFTKVLNVAPELIKARIKKGIRAKVITQEDSTVNNALRFEDEKLRETRIMPGGRYAYDNVIYIYNNKVNIISLKDELALIIESEDISNSWRGIFNFCWDKLEK